MVSVPQNHLEVLTNKLRESCSASVSKDDEIIFHEGGKARKGMLSFILSQPAIHMSEHRGEVATILKPHGFHMIATDI